MKKIAILGCENSHANAFLKYIKEKKEFSDIDVVGIYSDEAEPCEKLANEFGVRIMSSYDEAVGRIDGLVVTARHGDNHYKYAKPYIESGIPMFIDKPITVNEDEALEFMRALKSAGVRVTGGSSLRHDAFVRELRDDAVGGIDGGTLGGFVRAPLNSKNAYGGFFFYAQHLVEIVCEIFGRYPRTVRTSVSGDKTTVIFRYDDYDCVGLFVEGNNIYYACRMSEKRCKGADLKKGEGNDWYYMEFSEFSSLLNGEDQDLSYDDFIAPVFVMNAIYRSLESGNEEKVREYKV